MSIDSKIQEIMEESKLVNLIENEEEVVEVAEEEAEVQEEERRGHRGAPVARDRERREAHRLHDDDGRLRLHRRRLHRRCGVRRRGRVPLRGAQGQRHAVHLRRRSCRTSRWISRSTCGASSAPSRS